MNPLLSSLSFSLDLEAMGKFLSVLSSALFVSCSRPNWLSGQFLIWLETPGPWFCSQIPCWDVLAVWSAVPQLFGISPQSPCRVHSWFKPFSRPRFHVGSQ